MMLHPIPPQERETLRSLLTGIPHSIVEVTLTGGRGKVYADSMERPISAMLDLGFIVAMAGDPAYLSEMLALRKGTEIQVTVGGTEWQQAMIASDAQAVTRVRYALSPDALDVGHLRALSDVPEGYSVRPIDADVLRLLDEQDWAEDSIGIYDDHADYLANGFGWAMLREGEPVTQCTTFWTWETGAEIQIDTHPEYQRQGLATCAAANFMLDALSRGQTPHWDAANLPSLRLARKLGYRFTHAYVAWDVYA